MRSLVLLLILAPLMFSVSCTDCSDCEPFTEEPYLKVRFLNQVDSAGITIIIDTVNQVYAQDLRHFQGENFEFKFPLDMHHDTSVFNLVYHKPDDTESYSSNTVSVYYNREYIRRADNYVVVECDIIEFTSDFPLNSLVCKDSLNPKCISNEAIAKMYN